MSTSWFSWWFNAQPAAAESNGVADPTATRVYIDELKQKLAQDMRAERAECRLDFKDPSQMRTFLKTYAELHDNLMMSKLDLIQAEMTDDSLEVIDLRKVLAIREKRRREDLMELLHLQRDYVAYKNEEAMIKLGKVLQDLIAEQNFN